MGATGAPGVDSPRWDGVPVFAQPGALPAAALEQVIQAVRDLDMDEVRAKLAGSTAGR
ncbi:hypothetical protein OG799_07010 [Micromonospora sp. NBC_00898]|nr:hypothetical protein OG799_07010 [Micromonospora sp. NBC_00898]